MNQERCFIGRLVHTSPDSFARRDPARAARTINALAQTHSRNLKGVITSFPPVVAFTLKYAEMLASIPFMAVGKEECCGLFGPKQPKIPKPYDDLAEAYKNLAKSGQADTGADAAHPDYQVITRWKDLPPE